MRVRRILLGAFVAALLGGAFVYPIYPSQQSICDFSPAMVLTALAMQARGDVKVEKRARPIAP